ncbi:hypothetical protein LQU94_04530 [Peptoniphilus sp. KCTC 25270]|uniref:hypothetical protein n=1 Tax=Peptoniphilus sp. KCTC 25270 TaxID=2897414 RepID=UPI001E5B168E|nr:hypothetical protein [Peptoniphilus sp. KCTC 25270]MCD1147374.1 hypothetical protein [Peptoniphilus sp. KCTC 25270]
MKWYEIPKNNLLAIAGAIFFLLGTMIFRMGIPYFSLLQGQEKIFSILYILIVFSLFFFLIFRKVTRKQIARVKNHKKSHMPIYHCFAKPTFFMMIFMSFFGRFLQSTGIFSDKFLGFFYPGLGSAMALSGLLFLWAFFKKEGK